MTSAYLDHAASTPMRPEAVAALVEVSQQVPGNPSGQHRWARDARRLLDDARDQIAAIIGVAPGDIVFTSGGTEANNLAIGGTSAATGGRPLCSGAEHHAVLDPVRHVSGTVIRTEANSHIDLDALEHAVATEPDLTVVSAMAANNEVGTQTDLAAVAEAMERGRANRPPSAAHRPLLLHTDAVAAAAWVNLAEVAAPAQLISLSGHKVGGPKGIGVLAVRADAPIEALQLGGGQERDRRSGTQNVAGAVAFAAALHATAADRAATVSRVAALRDRLQSGLLACGPQVRATVDTASHPHTSVLPNIVHVCVRGVPSEALLFLLDEQGVAASAGSSCASGALEPSHVVAGMGLELDWLHGSLRFSLGWNTTDADIDHTLSVIPAALVSLGVPAPVGDRA